MPTPMKPSVKNTLNATPRFWVVLFIAFVLVFAPLYLISNNRCNQLKAQEAELLAQKQAQRRRHRAVRPRRGHDHARRNQIHHVLRRG